MHSFFILSYVTLPVLRSVYLDIMGMQVTGRIEMGKGFSSLGHKGKIIGMS